MSRSVVGWGFGLALLVAILSIGQAQAAGPLAVGVSFRPVDPVVIGNGATVVVELRVVGGGPLSGEPVELSLDGTYYRRSRTDASGAVAFPLPKDLVAGTHPLTAVYPGRSNTYLPASAKASLEVTPYQLQVQTVPSLPGMGFTLDGTRFVAGADGYARIPVSTPGDHVLIALDTEYAAAGTTAQFSRWTVNNEYSRQVTVSVPKVGPVQAGFDVSRPASQVFVDPSGGLVKADRITSFTLRSSLGQVLTYPDGRERVYKASRVVRRSSGLESVDVRYNVTDVEVDGSNVVNAGQQHFYTAPDAVWRISLLLYSARIQAKDALFGFTAGKAVEMIYPSGKSQIVDVGSNGEVYIPWLARGIYRVAVADAPGWAPSMPVALSRDQEVELRVISYLDMGVAGAVALIVIFGLLHRGRPHLIRDAARAVGAGVSGLRLPLPGAAHAPAAMRRPAEGEPTANASPPPVVASPPPVLASAPSTATQQPQLAQQATEGSAKVAPILATIARRSDIDALDRVALAHHRTMGVNVPVSPDLIELAPSLFGPQVDEPPPPTKPRPTPLPPLRAPESAVGDAAPAPTPAAPAPTPATPAPAELAAEAAPGVADESLPSKPARTRRAAKRPTTKKVTEPSKAVRAKRSTANAAPADATSAPKRAAAPKAAKTKVPRKKATATTPARRAPAKAASRQTSASAKRTVRKKAAPSAPRRDSSRTVSATRASSTTPASGTRETGGTRPSRTPRKPAAGRSSQAAVSGAAGQPVDEPTETPPKGAEMQACRNCGLELWAGASYCRRCGEPTIGAGATDDAPSAGPRSPKRTATPRGRSRRRPATPSAGSTRARGSRRGKG